MYLLFLYIYGRDIYPYIAFWLCIQSSACQGGARSHRWQFRIRIGVDRISYLLKNATCQKIKRYRISGIRPDIVRMAIPDKDRGRPDIISDKHSVSQTVPDKATDGPDIKLSQIF